MRYSASGEYPWKRYTFAMCVRFALKPPPAELVTRFGLDEHVDFAPRYGISPGTDIPANLVVNRADNEDPGLIEPAADGTPERPSPAPGKVS